MNFIIRDQACLPSRFYQDQIKLKKLKFFQEPIFLFSYIFPTSDFFKESEQEAWNLHLNMISDFKVDIHFFRSE